jgi:hypothetical protein
MLVYGFNGAFGHAATFQITCRSTSQMKRPGHVLSLAEKAVEGFGGFSSFFSNYLNLLTLHDCA